MKLHAKLHFPVRQIVHNRLLLARGMVGTRIDYDKDKNNNTIIMILMVRVVNPMTRLIEYIYIMVMLIYDNTNIWL